MKYIAKRFKYALVVWVETVSMIVFCLPRFRFLNYLKSLYLRSVFRARVGRRVVFYPGIWVFTGRNLELGDDVDLARGVLLTTDGGIHIGSRTLVGYGTQILSSNHAVPPKCANIFDAGHVSKPVVIGPDCWIGANAVILPGVTIGKGTVVGAGSVVTKDLPEFVYAAGVPANVIKHRT